MVSIINWIHAGFSCHLVGLLGASEGNCVIQKFMSETCRLGDFERQNLKAYQFWTRTHRTAWVYWEDSCIRYNNTLPFKSELKLEHKHFNVYHCMIYDLVKLWLQFSSKTIAMHRIIVQSTGFHTTYILGTNPGSSFWDSWLKLLTMAS